MPNFDPHAVAAILRQLAAEEIMTRYGKLHDQNVQVKGSPKDYVTDADTSLERRAIPMLQSLLPGSLFVGEESASAAKDQAALMSGKLVWVNDPVDGTLHFVKGIPGFTSMASLVQNGRALAGWIYDPLRDLMLMGVVGQGAWLNDKKIEPLAQAAPDAQHGVRIPDYNYLTEPLAGHFRQMASQFGRFENIFPAGDSMMTLFDGRGETVVFRDTGKAWDIYPGAAIIEAAGGRFAYADGQDYVHADPRRRVPLVGTRCAAAWNGLVEKLVPKDILRETIRRDTKADTNYEPC